MADLNKKVLQDFKRARDNKKAWIEEAEEDYRFAAGKQWEDNDVETLRKAGVEPLTVNKIQPNINLLSGIQRQNKTDYISFPVGEEDTLNAFISTRLLKYATNATDVDDKQSEQFEDGTICGEGWLEAYMDYTHDLINGELKFKKVNPLTLFVDPDSTEYDLSDAQYVIKFSPGLTKDQVIKLFPDKEKRIDQIKLGSLNLDSIANDKEQVLDYPNVDKMDEADFEETDTYDLTEYYYKKYVTKYIIADKVKGELKELDNQEDAERYVEFANAQKPNSAKLLKRKVPEIWVTALVGTREIDDYKCSFYPEWKSYPFFPFFGHRITTPLKDKEYMVQGIVRSLKSPQKEINKRRTQELRHLNSSANSGWLAEKGSFVDKSKAKKYGSTPGVILEYKAGTQRPPERITPTPLSQGHSQLVAEQTQDMTEISGINKEFLSLEANQQSGRAIMLRQKQGMVMVQRLLDNFSKTKKLVAKFILSQLGEIYSIEKASKILGNAFIQQHFSQQDPQTGKPVVNKKAVEQSLRFILENADFTKYDINVGEGRDAETVKFANYMLLTELLQNGVGIPPSVLIDESMLSPSSKEKIKKGIQQQQQAQQQQIQIKSQGEMAKAAKDKAQAQETAVDTQIKTKKELAESQAEIKKTQAETNKILVEIQQMLKGQQTSK